MRTGMVMAALLLASATGAGAQGLPPEAKAAAGRYYDCMIAEAVRMDDKRSDAATIAQAVVALCRHLQQPIAAALGRSGGDPQFYMQYLDGRALQSATTFVLASRRRENTKRAPKPAAPKAKPKGETI